MVKPFLIFLFSVSLATSGLADEVHLTQDGEFRVEVRSVSEDRVVVRIAEHNGFLGGVFGHGDPRTVVLRYHEETERRGDFFYGTFSFYDGRGPALRGLRNSVNGRVRQIVGEGAEFRVWLIPHLDFTAGVVIEHRPTGSISRITEIPFYLD